MFDQLLISAIFKEVRFCGENYLIPRVQRLNKNTLHHNNHPNRDKFHYLYSLPISLLYPLLLIRLVDIYRWQHLVSFTLEGETSSCGKTVQKADLS